MSENHTGDRLSKRPEAITAEGAATRLLVLGNALQFAAAALAPSFMNTVVAEATKYPVEPAPQTQPAANHAPQPYEATSEYAATPTPQSAAQLPLYEETAGNLMSEPDMPPTDQYFDSLASAVVPEQPAQATWQEANLDDDARARLAAARQGIALLHDDQAAHTQSNYDLAA